jgi:putative ABC transport system substrate-binding protein
MAIHIRRRELISMIGGAAAAWPLTARAQQAAMPVVGLLGGVSPEPFAEFTTALRQGLGEAGYIEGRNLRIEERWAHGRLDRIGENSPARPL